MNYTKGEWKPLTKFAYIPSRWNVDITVENNGEIEIIGQITGKTAQEAQDNANLITASLDMYEALKFLLNPSFGNDGWLLSRFPEAYSLCSKALAKAEGKED